MRGEIIHIPSEEMAEPPLQYFWALEDVDGTTYAQFDFASGQEHKIPDPDFKHWKSVAWIPFKDENLIAYLRENGHNVSVSDYEYVHVILKDTEKAKVFRRGIISFSDYYECNVCGTTFIWQQDENNIYAVCPVCGAHNIWVCDIHHEVTPIFLQNGERRCPECERIGPPRGCTLIRNLVTRNYVQKSIYYGIQILRGDVIEEIIIRDDGTITISTI